MRDGPETLSDLPDVEGVARALGGEPGLAWLDDARGGWTIFSVLPGERLSSSPGWVDQARGLLREEAPRHGLPFEGGLIGWISYEAGRWHERMPSRGRPPGLPELGLARYDGALLRRGDRGPWLLVGPPRFRARIKRLLRGGARPRPSRAVTAMVVEDGAPDRFLRGVDELLEAIAAGELYQANLSRQIALRFSGDPLEIYLRLRRLSPAAFGAFLRTPGGAVLSNSPELYLRLDGGEVLSRPIKGTCALGEDAAQRRALAAALEADPKERAELTMIVDLVRNDLGRVCAPGTVKAGPRRITALPGLHHAHQEVRGRLREGLDALDLIDASFPPGSVTGAPKVQAMARIAALEAHRRDVYTGAIGWLADGGGACLSVAIRTAVVRGQLARFHVGCGVVADSLPRRELEESELKARALLSAFGQLGSRRGFSPPGSSRPRAPGAAR